MPEAERTVLHLRVVDAETGRPLPARVRVERDGAAVPFANHVDPPFCGGTGGSLKEVGEGVLAVYQGLLLWRGEGRLPAGLRWSHPKNACSPESSYGLGFGTVTVVANAGPAYELDRAEVELLPGAGERSVTLRLARALRVPGYLALDTHIHCQHGSGDSAVPARFRAMGAAASGLQVIAMTDHNVVTDLEPELAALFPADRFPGGPPAIAFRGTEAAVNYLHVNVFPYPADEPPFIFPGEIPPPQALALLQPLRARFFVQLNHPRFAWGAYFNSPHCANRAGAPGWSLHDQAPPCPLGFDGMEILSGFTSCETRTRQSVEDWYALMRLGHRVTGTGASDSHTDSRMLPGYPRTYLHVGHDEPRRLGAADLISALRAGNAVASNAPFVRLTARVGEHGYQPGDTVPAPGGELAVELELQTPSWAPVDEVRLLQDGVVLQTFPVPAGQVTLRAQARVPIRRDVFLNVEASGRTAMPSWITGDLLEFEGAAPGVLHCPNQGGKLGLLPFAVSNPIYVDAEGDDKLEFFVPPP